MVSLKHKFITAKADGVDSTLVRPTGWNDEHEFNSIGDGIVLGRPVGLGPGAIQEMAISALLYSGMITLWAGLVSPVGWYLCDGTVRPVGDAPQLAAVCGNRFGGDGVSTFATPDLRGRVVCMIDGGVGRSPGFNSPGTVGGGHQNSAGVGVGNYFAGGSWTALGYTTGAQSVRVFGNTSTEGGGLGTVGGGPATGSHSHFYDSTHNTNGENLSVNVNNFGASGGTAAFSIIQAMMALNFIIKGG